MDPARRRVRVSGREVELTTREFHLLYVLLSSPGIVFSREALLSRIWKKDTRSRSARSIPSSSVSAARSRRIRRIRPWS